MTASALTSVSDDSPGLSGTLTGAEIEVPAPEGIAVSSSTEALAAALWFAYLNEAATMFEQNYATAADIDASMRFGCGYPVGPLAQIDSIGADKVETVLNALHEASGDRRHEVSAAISERAASGEPFISEDGGSAPELTGTPRDIASVGVVGTGTMASGIVEVFAKSGIPVTFVARSDEKVQKVQAAITKSLERAVSKGKLSEADRDEILGRITGTTSHADLSEVDLIVEAIVEDLDTKKELFESLDRVAKPGAILATTTSSLSIADIAAATSRPNDFIGMHFFNPAPVMKLVEVVSADDTAADVTATVVDLCHKVGKHPVLCGDRAGFIVNFLLFPYLNDAVLAVEAKLVDIETLDPVMKQWQSLPMGPFALLDVVGTDVSLAIEDVIYDAFGGEEYEAAPLLRQTVEAGKLGRKTGEGFLSYS